MYRKNMDGLLVSNAPHSMTLLKLVEYYHRKHRNIEEFVLFLITIIELVFRGEG